MTREEAKNIMSQMIKDEEGFLSDNIVEAHKMAIKALEQESCGDAISRQAVLDMMQMRMSGKELYKAVYDLPPVNPQPKTGKWIKSRDSYGNNHFTCPFCENDIATKYDGAWEDNYCSNCGAKMVEPQESEEV